MIANNWADCPKCNEDARKVYKKLETEFQSSYGKVSQDKYMSMIQEIDDGPVVQSGQSLREDYEIGIFNDGEFYIKYRSHCSNCGLEFNYDHSEFVNL